MIYTGRAGATGPTGPAGSGATLPSRRLTGPATFSIAATDGVCVCDCTLGNVIANLPDCLASDEAVIEFKIFGAGGTVTINALGSDTIDGDASVVLTAPPESLTFYSDASAWRQL